MDNVKFNPKRSFPYPIALADLYNTFRSFSLALPLYLVAEESSEDELMHDTRKPAKPTGPPKVTNPSKQSSSSEPTRASKKSRLSQPVVVSNAAEPASETTTDQVAQLPPVEWVFWVQVSEEVGYWRLFSEFPNTAQVLFKCKFSTDYLQKPGHVADYARMLRSRETYRYRDVCVGNVTYWRRNEPSKRKIAEGNKEMTCDTCLNTGRFCARMVKVDGVVKLGFFPVPDAARNGVGWEKLYYWAGEKKVAKPQQSSYM
ncbi:uncharacterized protein M421DRAFT_1383 [Didymella exigua CBS 183.55]|uniref:Uncharacterized protein n=1 Tax=Didymella exigua CBS 183.55 TaxID=1150837 RepID=A0A6A5S2T9_9PLEO|nr:uncharacterized protein M421DRAFT_1383 [Didymella exigua CBS 183.55]KAF1932796.1 hypothetical protein M421DRAFT_1383 [Didymella exigua CBS 183.55]